MFGTRPEVSSQFGGHQHRRETTEGRVLIGSLSALLVFLFNFLIDSNKKLKLKKNI